MLLDMIIRVVDQEQLSEMYTHALTAIIMHNSFYKYLITDYTTGFNEGRHFNLNMHPLAYLLMLCDEQGLQRARCLFVCFLNAMEVDLRSFERTVSETLLNLSNVYTGIQK